MEYSWLQSLLLVNNVQDLDRHVNSFMANIEQITNKCFKLGNLSYKTTIRWYSDELKSDRNKVAALYRVSSE